MKIPAIAIFCSAISVSLLFSQDSQRVLTGTGFYVGQNTIITCAHVVAGAQVVQVVDAHQIRKTAKVVVLDPVSDIAVLRVPGTSPGTLAIAKADAAGVMDPIIVVGFPLASVIGTEISASEGRINAIRQTVNGPIIQLDAAVNHGDSGGPVLDEYGAVVGMAVAKMESTGSTSSTQSATERVNFAIPAETIDSVCARSGFNLLTSYASRVLDARSIFRHAQAAAVMIYSTGTGKTNQVAQTTKVGVEDQNRAVRWAQDFVMSLTSDSVDREARFFADTVNYQDSGDIDKEKLRQILSAEHKLLPRRSLKLERAGVVQRSEGSETAGVGLVYAFDMSGPGNTRQVGKMQVEVLLSDFDHTPKIVYYRQGTPR